MIGTSDPEFALFLSMIRNSHVRSFSMLLFKGTQLVSDDFNIADGSVTADRDSNARRKMSLTIPLTQWDDSPVQLINVIDSRIQLGIGFDLGAYSLNIPLGVFRVDSLGRKNDAELVVEGVGLEAYVYEHEVLDATEIPTEASRCIDSIETLIRNAFPDAVFDTPYAADVESRRGVTLDSAPTDTPKRWDAIQAYARRIGCVVYCAPSGKFRIAREPDVTAGTPVWLLDEGANGVLIGVGTKVTRENTYNAVRASGETVAEDIPACTALVKDDDPNSPTRYGGPFGMRTYEYQDNLLLNPAMCEEKARLLLNEFKAATRSLNMSAVPNPALEPDDIVEIDMLDGTVERHLLTSMTIPLGLGEWSANTLSVRVPNKTSKNKGGNP